MKVIEKTEGQKGSYTILGSAYLNAGNLAEAKKCYLAELKNNPTDSEANYNLGKIAFEEKKFAEATAYFSRVAYLPVYQSRLQKYWKVIEKEIFMK